MSVVCEVCRVECACVNYCACSAVCEECEVEAAYRKEVELSPDLGGDEDDDGDDEEEDAIWQP